MGRGRLLSQPSVKTCMLRFMSRGRPAFAVGDLLKTVAEVRQHGMVGNTPQTLKWRWPTSRLNERCHFSTIGSQVPIVRNNRSQGSRGWGETQQSTSCRSGYTVSPSLLSACVLFVSIIRHRQQCQKQMHRRVWSGLVSDVPPSALFQASSRLRDRDQVQPRFGYASRVSLFSSIPGWRHRPRKSST
jgi:hypothetical protein